MLIHLGCLSLSDSTGCDLATQHQGSLLMPMPPQQLFSVATLSAATLTTVASASTCIADATPGSFCQSNRTPWHSSSCTRFASIVEFVYCISKQPCAACTTHDQLYIRMLAKTPLPAPATVSSHIVKNLWALSLLLHTPVPLYKSHLDIR